MQRIVITGPESSGKTTLARELAERFNALYVPEYSRLYLSSIGLDYQLSDIVNIAVGQLALVESMEPSADQNDLMIIDTWMLELRIWARYRFNVVPDLLEVMYREHFPDLYVLCTPDIEWQYDPLRENPHDRDVLFGMYQDAIIESNVPYLIANGTGEDRANTAFQTIEDWMNT